MSTRLIIHGSTGRMGARLIALAANDSRYEIVSQLSRADDASRAAPCDAVIDFSTDEGAQRAAEIALAHRAALLVGTTALSQQTLEKLGFAATSIPVMIAPNTSLGVAVLNFLIAHAARLLGPEADIALTDVHHKAKRDAPSGTAMRLARTLRAVPGARLPDDHIHCLRAGDVVGEHTVEFFLPGERILLRHAASSRDLFASGALRAAAWLAGRAPGYYTIEDSLGLSA